MDYDDAIRQYGVDKPDLRLPAFTDVRDCFGPADLEQLAINKDLPVIAIRTPGVGELSRKERDDIKPMFVSKGGARVFEDFKRIETKFPKPQRRFARNPAPPQTICSCWLSGRHSPEATIIRQQAQSHARRTGDLCLRRNLAHGVSAEVCRLPRHFQKSGIPQRLPFRVTNFPMFEYDEGEKRWMAAHHPFTFAPRRRHGQTRIRSAMVRALAYDVVLNGTELAPPRSEFTARTQRRTFSALA